MTLPLGQNGYLRVTTPQTSDGTTLRYTEDQRLITKETHLPLTAKKFIEAENADLPQHLRHKIDVVSNEVEPKPKGKPGPKPKGSSAEDPE